MEIREGEDHELLTVLAELETLTVPQRAMVMAKAVGMFVAAAAKQRGMTQSEAEVWLFGQLRNAADEARIEFPVN